MYRAQLAVSLLVLLALVLGAAPARAETVNCTAITAVPAVITVRGIYCLTGNLLTGISSGNAIEIQTNNVVLDLNGFSLSGLSAGSATSAFGIYALDRRSITIKNGTIRGFFKGIFLDDAGVSAGHVVEDIRADQNTYTAIAVLGAGQIIRNNHVLATGGSMIFGADANAFGILVGGKAPRVLNNDIVDVVAQGAGASRGISFFSATAGLAVNNRITGANVGIAYEGSTGKYRDTLTFAVGTLALGGTNAGNNN